VARGHLRQKSYRKTLHFGREEKSNLMAARKRKNCLMDWVLGSPHFRSIESLRHKDRSLEPVIYGGFIFLAGPGTVKRQ